MTRRNLRIVGAAAVAVLGIAVTAYAMPVPHTFSPGTTISSSAVNENFEALAGVTPVAFGVIRSDGTVSASTSGITATWDAASSRYVITIPGESYLVWSYVTVVTPLGGSPRVATTDSIGGQLMIRFSDLAGNSVQSHFHFVTFKP